MPPKVRYMRVWLDELERLPEYSFSYPTGVCHGKTWRLRDTEGGWWVRRYWRMPDGVIYTFTWRAELLQGPRRGNEALRFKIECSRVELRDAESC